MHGNQSILTIGPAWQKDHPRACLGILAMERIVQSPEAPALEAASREVEEELSRRFTDRAGIKGHPVIKAYADYYKGFKKTYHVAAQAESVALKGRKIPRFTPLVQAMFTAELKNLMLTAGHDLAQVQRPVRLESSQGDEVLEAMGGKSQPLKAGDMYVRDERGILSAIIHGPAQRASLGKQTGSALFTVYGVPGVARAGIEKHLIDMEALIRLFSPGAATLEREVYPA